MAKPELVVKRGMSVMEFVPLLQAGYTVKQIEQALREIDYKAAKEPGKAFGACASCGYETVLVADVGLCGPCTFGEAETANGNW